MKYTAFMYNSPMNIHFTCTVDSEFLSKEQLKEIGEKQVEYLMSSYELWPSCFGKCFMAYKIDGLSEEAALSKAAEETTRKYLMEKIEDDNRIRRITGFSWTHQKKD